MSANTALAVALIGPGNVGSAFLDQLHAAQPRLLRDGGRNVELKAVCNSKRMALGKPTLDAASWRGALDGDGKPCDLTELTRYLGQHRGPVAVVDTTASAKVAEQHSEWLRRGFGVVTANKLACSAPLSRYRELCAAERSGGSRYLYETTVGAGLPVIGVLRDFVRTGDEILEIEGVLSGTLSHLTAALARGERFSEVIRRLHSEGYTEPDPRIDLGGTDVARKLLILSRVAGAALAVEDVQVTGLLPAESAGAPHESVEDFLGGCERFDDLLADRFAAARSADLVPCYVARLSTDGKAGVGLATYPREHAFARMVPGDNLIQVKTRRYQRSPLVIQGPGAGREVTAAGVFADLLRL